MTIPSLKIKRLGKFFWILGLGDFGPVGPYDNKGRANEDRKGLIRFFRHENEPGFVTVDKKEKRHGRT